MALLLTVATGAWAQDPDPIDLTPSADGTVWTLSTMPEYDVELEVTYYTDEEVAEMEEAAYTAGVDLTPSADGKTWTLAATPAFDIELEVEYETALALSETTDNCAALTEWDGYEADVTLTRTLQAGGYNTFAVPFNMAIPEGWTVKELNTASIAGQVLTLNFADATTIEAGKPYLVKVATQTDLSQAAFAGAIVSKETQPYTSATVDFIPTLGATDIETDDVRKILFLGAENTLYRPNSTSSRMKGFRAYFQLKDAAEVKGFELNLGDEDATGIIEIQNSKFKNQDDDVIYNVAGQRLERTQRGINIVSGKKLIIK